MAKLRNSEIRGVLIIIAGIIGLGIIFATATGKLEQWFGISWSPKAFDKIIFVSDKTGTAEIYLMNKNGSGKKKITDNAKVTSAPAISPRANKIAFIGNVGSWQQVFLMNVDGSDLRQVTNSSDYKTQPAFSPDGKYLSYIASGKVYVANSYGENPRYVLPTYEQSQAAMKSLDREMQTFGAYSWSSDSKGMAGITKDPFGNDMLVYLAQLGNQESYILQVIKDPNDRSFLVFAGGEEQKIQPVMQVSHNKPVKIFSMSWAKEKPLLALSIDTGDAGAIILINGEDKTANVAVVEKKVRIGEVAISADGGIICAQILGPNNKLNPELSLIDLNSGEVRHLASGVYEYLHFSADSKKILASKIDTKNNTKSIVEIDVETSNVKTLAGEGNCYFASWTPEKE